MKKQTVLVLLALVLLAVPSIAADAESIYKASCAGCHGVDGGKAAGASAPIKGKSADAILKMLNGYADGTYGGDKKAIMVNIIKKHSPEELKGLSEYIGTL